MIREIKVPSLEWLSSDEKLWEVISLGRSVVVKRRPKVNEDTWKFINRFSVIPFYQVQWSDCHTFLRV